MEKNIFGFVKSEFDGSEHIYSESSFDENMDYPKSFSYQEFLPEIINQGENPICVPCSFSSYLNWKINLEDGDNKENNKIDYFEIYNCRSNKNADGMCFKEALSYVRHNGVKTKEGRININEYNFIADKSFLRRAIFNNGPCLGGLPVYNYNKEFWKKNPGDKFMGGHAIALIGYDENGFIIRNSWGKSFGNKGYTYISNKDAEKLLMETWTIIS